MNLFLNLSHFIKINSKWIMNLNIKYVTVKLLKEKKRISLGFRAKSS